MDSNYLQARIDATKAAIEAAENAQTAMLAGGIQTYKLDTGQSVQSVTKFNITELRNYINGLYNLLGELCARQTGSGVMVARPSW